MKTLRNTWMMAAAVLLAMTTMTSCDRDHDEAYVLSGEWKGDFGMYYYDGFSDMSYRADYTNIRFIPSYDYGTYGYGEEIDYFRWPCPVRYQSFYFHWEIRHGVIYLDYPYAHDLDVAIYDYRLTDGYFSGRIGDTSDWFTLYKLTGYYDWYLYDPSSYYGYSYYDPYYYGYAKGRDGAASKPEQVQGGEPEGFRFGRSFGGNQADE